MAICVCARAVHLDGQGGVQTFGRAGSDAWSTTTVRLFTPLTWAIIPGAVCGAVDCTAAGGVLWHGLDGLSFGCLLGGSTQQLCLNRSVEQSVHPPSGAVHVRAAIKAVHLSLIGCVLARRLWCHKQHTNKSFLLRCGWVRALASHCMQAAHSHFGPRAERYPAGRCVLSCSWVLAVMMMAPQAYGVF